MHRRTSGFTKNLNQQSHMEHENLDIESITEARRKAIEASIRTISIQELKSLGGELFPFFDNPWRERFFEFIEQNKGHTFYYARAKERIEVVYCHAKEKGMWFVRGNGMGLVQERWLKILKEIVDQRRSR